MIIDFHCHVGHSLDGNKQTLAQLARKKHINKFVVFAFDERNCTVEEQSFNLLKQSKGKKRFMPFFRFDPKRMTAEKLKEALDQGFYGVKLHSNSENFDPSNKKFYPLYKEIAKSGKPLLLHVKKYHLKKTDPLLAAQIARNIPQLKLVIAHFASVQPKAFEYVMKHKLKNVYFDTSISSYKWYIEKIGRKMGFNRFLFASDCPYSDQEVELLKIKKLDISREDKNKILGGNAHKLLKL